MSVHTFITVWTLGSVETQVTLPGSVLTQTVAVTLAVDGAIVPCPPDVAVTGEVTVLLHADAHSTLVVAATGETTDVSC